MDWHKVSYRHWLDSSPFRMNCWPLNFWSTAKMALCVICTCWICDLQIVWRVTCEMWACFVTCEWGRIGQTMKRMDLAQANLFMITQVAFVPKQPKQTKQNINCDKPEKQHHINLFILERFPYCNPWDNISHSIFSDNTSEKEFILCTLLIIETATWQVRKVKREGQNLAFPSLPHSFTITPWSGCKCQIVVYRRLQKWSDPLMRDLEGAWWGPGYVFLFF